MSVARRVSRPATDDQMEAIRRGSIVSPSQRVVDTLELVYSDVQNVHPSEWEPLALAEATQYVTWIATEIGASADALLNRRAGNGVAREDMLVPKQLWVAYGQPGEMTTPRVNFEGSVADDYVHDPAQSIEQFGDGSILLRVWANARDEAVSNWRHESDVLAQA